MTRTQSETGRKWEMAIKIGLGDRSGQDRNRVEADMISGMIQDGDGMGDDTGRFRMDPDRYGVGGQDVIWDEIWDKNN